MKNSEELDNYLDVVDASVYSGELLYSQQERDILQMYCERWLRAIQEHKELELLEEQS